MTSQITVDLRSDTVTRPGSEMRQAMSRAEVGDDVFGEDPTINRLQEMAAKLTGKEAALFMPSGTMSNQVAIKTHTHHGDSVVVGEGAHSYLLESGAISALSGVVPLVAGRGGLFSKEEFLGAVMGGGNIHNPGTTLVMMENSHNRGGGVVFPLKDIEEICREASAMGIKSHLDGARLFNASVATKTDAKLICRNFDSISFCLSKGLGAPVGSLLCGSKDFVSNALRFRKMFGGGMRQVGILGAAGIYALEHNIDRLAEDHRRARRLAEVLSDLPGIEIDLTRVQTNIVIFKITRKDLNALGLFLHLNEQGVLTLPTSKDSIRLVTHLDVDDNGIEYAAGVFKRLLS